MKEISYKINNFSLISYMPNMYTILCRVRHFDYYEIKPTLSNQIK